MKDVVLPLPKNPSTLSADFFIQAAGLVYHHHAKRGAYHQPFGAVSHHALACIFLRLDDIPQQVADDIQSVPL